MPLSEHEQRILEDIEKRLSEDDPRLAQAVSSTSLYSHVARRIRWASLGFIAGFVMLMLFWFSIWVALAGFAVMLVSALLVYGYVKQIGQEQLRTIQRSGSFTLPALLLRITKRFPSK